MIHPVFNRLGGEKAVHQFMNRKYPSIAKSMAPSIQEHSDEGTVKPSLRKPAPFGKSSVKESMESQEGIKVKSQVTNLMRSPYSPSGMV